MEQARSRLNSRPHVEVQQLELPRQWPDGRFDLVVLTELARYFSPADLARLVDLAIDCLDDGGHIVAVHHRAPGPIPHSAEQVHGGLLARPELLHLAGHQEPDFLLAAFARRDRERSRQTR